MGFFLKAQVQIQQQSQELQQLREQLLLAQSKYHFHYLKQN